jgi:hypothetical protein
LRYWIPFACKEAPVGCGTEDVRRALQYVIDEQGEPMALFVAENL